MSFQHAAVRRFKLPARRLNQLLVDAGAGMAGIHLVRSTREKATRI
jgi:hypothetical protein